MCHDQNRIPAFAATDFVANCAPCHTASGTGGLHAARATSSLPIANDCVACHDVAAPQHGADLVGDNNGVRAITAEFAKRSHHVTGRGVTNADCVACHLEGKVSGSAIVIDPLYHMADNKTHLRNGNAALAGNQTTATAGPDGQSQYAWNPAAPNHTLMDQFCFSCHNEAGAPTAVAALAAVPSATGFTRTALNPFGDSVSNAYDQVSRINVVGVYEQFDTDNSSHHAVRGRKYNSRNLTAAQFTNISTANFNFRNGVVSSPIRGVKNTPTTFRPDGSVLAAGVVTGTMFETGKFTPTYTTLNNEVLADNNVLHCGDCHTVGQFRAADVNTAAGSFNKAAIGAHGSNNEYLLRNSNGDDTFARDALVCFICHRENLYSNPGQTASEQEDGIVAHNSVNNSFADCNGNNENSAGLVGAARLVPDERTMDDATFQAQVAAGIYTNTGGGNIFGIKCANCHNASDKKTFGGIHGNAGNASYLSYSGAKTVDGVVSTVARKPYRFMPGLGNFRYNGGDSPEQWTVRTLSQANKQGCYTLNGASTVTRAGARVPNPSPTKAVASGANVSSLAIADDNGILGSWGACTDHAGTSVFAGRATTRTLLRPLTY
ncbi:MAG: hypothetical protein A2075_14140 [Geobacteraceae bacterium GWC2_58_44]|nr:MAG: hypothetical protein A2075_14140 [Geobacteraceae bacterium GWC2_58_44]